MLGKAPAKASMSFLGVEPIEILRFPAASGSWYATLGMSRHPMSEAGSEVSVVPTDGARAELLLETQSGVDEVWRSLATLAASPAVEGVFYRVGMTVDLGTPMTGASRCSGVVVVESGLSPISTSAGEVDILKVVPATATELAWARIPGSAALATKWTEQRTNLLDLSRSAVPLD